MIKNNTRVAWLLLPLFGILLFVCLYVVSTFFYPGGSQVDKNSQGFSWLQNYWCNLLNETAINGQPNGARPIALTAMAVLCVSLAAFWWLFPEQAGVTKTNRRVIQTSGLLAMTTGAFLFTKFHDSVIIVATGFGLVALAGTFAALRRRRWMRLFWLGLFSLILIVLNNLLYYGGLRFYLPVVQKITFLYFLLWVCAIAIKLYQKNKAGASSMGF